MDVQVLRRVGRKYYRPGDRVLRQPSAAEIADLLTELCAPSGDPEWWNHGVLGRPDADDGVEFMVAPLTGYVALMWTGTAERSLNPQPFADAPLLPDNADDDPLMFWPRSAYLSPAAGKRALAEHVVTGVRPTSVGWQPWGWEVRELPRWLKPDMPEYSAFHLIEN
jgi:hypothetical protein